MAAIMEQKLFNRKQTIEEQNVEINKFIAARRKNAVNMFKKSTCEKELAHDYANETVNWPRIRFVFVFFFC